MINIDSRGCGVGKTTGTTNSIFADVKEKYLLGQQCLIVLPSIRMFKEYDNYLSSIIDCPDDLVSIHSGNSDTQTVHRLFEALGDRKQIIVITAHTFMKHKWHNGVKQNYYLYIDEALTVYRELKFWEKRTSKITLDWSKHTKEVSLINSNIYAPDWHLMTVEDGLADSSFVSDNASARQLQDSNWLNWVTAVDYQCMLSPISNRAFYVIQELNADIMREWKYVRVACAAFHVTFMSAWLTSNKIDYKVLPHCKFVKSTANMTVHFPVLDNAINWSMSKKKNGHWIHAAFSEYVQNLSITDPVLFLRNKNDSTKGLYATEQSVPFNAHGLNDWMKYNKVSLEATINLTPQLNKWFKDHLTDFDSYLARTGYDFYQVLMRCCLRLGKPADVYVIEVKLVTQVFDHFFEDFDYEYMEFQSLEADAKLQGHKAIPLTSAQKQKSYRERKKQELIENKLK